MDQLVSSDHFLTPTLVYFLNFCLALFFFSAFGSAQHFMLFVYFLFLSLEYQSPVGRDLVSLFAVISSVPRTVTGIQWVPPKHLLND